MNKFVELPLIEPVYQTYHYQGTGSAILKSNPTIRNWFLNEIMNLRCSRKFLSGYTTPEITIDQSGFAANPYLERYWMSLHFAKGYINPIIREMLNNGYYVTFGGVDDFYIPGKSWYKKRHFAHDGLICGYNQNDKTFCIYAYNSNWTYQKFWIPQKSFNMGCASTVKHYKSSGINALKPTSEIVAFSPEIACKKIVEYLDSSLEKYPMDGDGTVLGVVVHAYIAEYVAKLYDGSIPYERMDWRVFRVIWEHKKVMLERIQAIEHALNMGNAFSNTYQMVVAEANTMRMLYASHHMKRRDSILPTIYKQLLALVETEKEILSDLINAVRKDLKNATLEIY